MGYLKEWEKDGAYELDGVYYEDATSVLQCGVLKFCGCGQPEANLDYIRVGLELIDEAFREDDEGNERSFTEKWNELDAKRKAHFGNTHAEYFFYYWACDEKDFTEHGGAVPGWLTEKGRAFMETLQEWKAMQPKEEGE